jgi:hypothetical protein
MQKLATLRDSIFVKAASEILWKAQFYQKNINIFGCRAMSRQLSQKVSSHRALCIKLFRLVGQSFWNASCCTLYNRFRKWQMRGFHLQRVYGR